MPAKKAASARRKKPTKPTKPTIPGSVVEATSWEIKQLAERDVSLACSALAAAAVELARQMDEPKNSATSKSMCAKELRETMARLRDLAPEDREENPLDEIRARREARLVAGTPDAADRVRSKRDSAS